MPSHDHRAAHRPRASSQLRQDPRRVPGPRPDRDPDPAATSGSSRSTSPPRSATDSGLEGRASRDLPDRELRQDAQARIHQVRPRQAALRARRVPPAAPDLRPAVPRLAAPEQGAADRGRGLPRRHADHDRRRRVHHQRRRARRRQPAPPLARASTSSSRSRPATASCTPAAIIPERGSWIELNVTKKDSARRPHRPDRQVLGDDAAAGDEPEVRHRRRHPPGVLRDARREKVVDGRSVAKIEGKIAVDDVVDPAEQRSGRRDHRRERPEDHQERRPRRSAPRGVEQGRGHGRRRRCR